MGQKIELKPCPFCSETKFIEIDDESMFYELQGKNDGAALKMSCQKCDLDLWEHSFHIRKYEKRLEILVEKWNRRCGNETD